MNRYFGSIDFCSQPKPIFVSLEQLLTHGLFLARPQVAAPVIFPHLESLFHVRFGRLKSKRLGVVHRSKHRDPTEKDRKQRATPAGKDFSEPVHRHSLISRYNAVIESRRDLMIFFNRFGGDPGVTDVDERFHFDESILNLMDDWKIKLRHGLKS